VKRHKISGCSSGMPSATFAVAAEALFCVPTLAPTILSAHTCSSSDERWSPLTVRTLAFYADFSKAGDMNKSLVFSCPRQNKLNMQCVLHSAENRRQNHHSVLPLKGFPVADD